MSNNKSSTFSEIDSFDEILHVFSSDEKSKHSHSHSSKCRHNHHNYCQKHEKVDARSQSEDVFQHLKSLWIIIPFMFLFIFKEAVIHSTGLWVLVSLCVTFFYLNCRLKGATQGFEPPIYAFLMSMYTCGTVCILFYLLSFRENEIHFGLFCMPNKIPSDDWISLLWAVIIVDFSLKIFTIFVKSLVVFLSSHHLFHIYTRSAILIWIEFISQVYRHLPPAVTWIRHITGDSTNSLSFRIFFCFSYVLLKPYQTNFISSTDEKELCPLCFENRSPDLAILGCNHTFCRDCMDRWLVQSNECPLCSHVLEDEFTTWRDGSTSWLVHFF